MFYRRFTQLAFTILFTLALIAIPAHAVENFKVSNYDGGSQIWFQAEDFDDQIPDTGEFFPVVDADGAMGQVVTRNGQAGGRIHWQFDISAAGGAAGTWYFWARLINPSNHSDWMIVDGDPDDTVPGTPPFDQGPFDNNLHRVFEQTITDWTWFGGTEGQVKDLKDGVNDMYIVHRQGTDMALWDAFVWADSPDYQPTDDDYNNAQAPAPATSVEAGGKLTTAWGQIKATR